MHPWVTEAIKTEGELKKEHGLKNKREIWKMGSLLKKYKDLAKKLIAIKTGQGEKEKKQMMEKLQKWGLVGTEAKLDDVLGLGIKDIMGRRLQSLVFRKRLARSMKQARQFIVHRQMMVGGRKITSPSYMVSREEEEQIRFDPNSSLSKEDHPERIRLEKAIEEEEVEIVKKIREKKRKKSEKKEEGGIEIKAAEGK